jgi:electron transport complex protein RnfB
VADMCSGCGICRIICPVDTIEGEKKQVHAVAEDRCVGCLLCVDRCPKEAIRVKAPEDSILRRTSR